MRRVAVFGNSGGGKSTLARRLSELTGLPLYPLDLVQFRPGGAPVSHAEYLEAHAEILAREAWIVDGYGDRATAWQRFAAADTLVYLDLPVWRHAWWVTKRLLKAAVAPPEGWPKGSPLWRSTLNSYRVIGLCHRHLTPRYRELVAQQAGLKRVHHLRSRRGIEDFLDAVRVENEQRRGVATF